MRPIDILLLTELFPPAIGGSAVLLQNVYRRVRCAPVSVLTGTPAADAPAPLLLMERETIDSSLRGVASMRAWAQHVRIASRIRRYHRRTPLLVHCGRALPEGIPALLATCSSQGLRYLSWAYGEEIATALTSREYGLVLKAVYRGASAVICCSAHTASLVRSVAPKVATFIVYPGVDARKFSPMGGALARNRLGLQDRFVLLSVGRLQRRKGHDLMLRALPSILEAFPAVHYVIAGDGEERTTLEALSDALGVRANVTFAGAVSDSDLPELYSACDVFVLPNRVDGADFEGFGIVYLEAAAAGKPAVGGRSGGVPEAILDGVTGSLVSGNDPNELARCICHLIGNADQRSAYGVAGRHRVLREFSWERAAEAVDDIHSHLTRHSEL